MFSPLFSRFSERFLRWFWSNLRFLNGFGLKIHDFQREIFRKSQVFLCVYLFRGFTSFFRLSERFLRWFWSNFASRSIFEGIWTENPWNWAKNPPTICMNHTYICIKKNTVYITYYVLPYYHSSLLPLLPLLAPLHTTSIVYTTPVTPNSHVAPTILNPSPNLPTTPTSCVPPLPRYLSYHAHNS